MMSFFFFSSKSIKKIATFLVHDGKNKCTDGREERNEINGA